MKFFREKNDEIYHCASMQARIFEKSSVDGLNTYDFIRAFIHSDECFQLDIVSFDNAGLSEREIYSSIKNKISNIKKKTAVYSPQVMHWIGFFYRYANYLTMIPSPRLYKAIPPKYLVSVYPTYHSLEISKAVSKVCDDKSEFLLTPEENFKHILSSPKENDENYLNVKEIKKLLERIKKSS